jgi:KaiC/GvpD/RAD55 family RecA-like ATPase
MNRAVLISGEPGAGKSTLALQFLAAGLALGERGIAVSIDQKPRHLIEDAAAFQWPLDAAAADGRLTLLDASPYFTKIRNKTKSSMPVEFVKKMRGTNVGPDEHPFSIQPGSGVELRHR